MQPVLSISLFAVHMDLWTRRVDGDTHARGNTRKQSKTAMLAEEISHADFIPVELDHPALQIRVNFHRSFDTNRHQAVELCL